MGGATLGRNRFFRVGDTIYHARLNCALVGKSGRARKGTSMAPVQRIYGAAERILQQQSTRPFPSGLSLKVSHGPLSSGEGLIYAIRDGDGEKDGEEGVLDKRLLCAEGEFGAALRAFQRQGNTLSRIIRSALDGTNLGPLVKHNRTFASNPHICLMAHITRHELIGLLGNSDIFNGFANRFMWMAVRRGPSRRPRSRCRMRTLKPSPKRSSHASSPTRTAGEGSRAGSVRSNSAEDYRRPVIRNSRSMAPVLRCRHRPDGGRRLRVCRWSTPNSMVLTLSRKNTSRRRADLLGTCRSRSWPATSLAARRPIRPRNESSEALAEGLRHNDIVDLFNGHLPGQVGRVLGDLQSRESHFSTIEETGGRPRKVWSLKQNGKAR